MMTTKNTRDEICFIYTDKNGINCSIAHYMKKIKRIVYVSYWQFSFEQSKFILDTVESFIND